jgi:tRNA(adenine34) deaminase
MSEETGGASAAQVSPAGPPRLTEPPGPARDLAAMQLALAEAVLAGEAGDVPIGAVVIAADGTVLGRGHNIREAAADPTGHAEIVALRAAAATTGAWRLTGATLVVTLEPCTMCAGALVLARVARLVYGAIDEKAGAVGSLWDVVRDRRLNHRPEVISGTAAYDCAALLNTFFATRRNPRTPS